MENNVYWDMVERVKRLPRLQVYRNNNTVAEIDGFPLIIEDIVKAAMISRLNLLLCSERGEGKTQLMNDVANNWFGGNSVYLRARPDSDPKEIYEKFNIDKLEKELTPAIKIPLVLIDEINRAPSITQNQFFNMFDGYIETGKGTRIPLGYKGYHVVIASANIGDGRYYGTFDVDPGLTDRFHIVLDMDNHPPDTKDNLEIILSDTDPIILDSKREDHIEDIIYVKNLLNNVEMDISAYLALSFLRDGLDYCLPEKSYGTKSKRMIPNAIPEICEGCSRLGDGCGYIRPLSVRGEKALKKFVCGIKVVAGAKGNTDEIVSYRDVFEAFKIMAPYSNIIDDYWVRREYCSNPSLAILDLTRRFQEGFDEKRELIEEAFLDSVKGKLGTSTLDKLNHEWEFCGEIFREINNIAQEQGDLSKKSEEEYKTLVKRYPILKVFVE
ncbi:MAG: hypothetical protein ACE5K4_00250 [Candidatus Hydrothermarchaeota archaeon]